ncbi:MAG: helix-turn-helix domain-containing protein [Flavobacteriaceae bacterium]|jgi:transcriptional regulator with XRE-family HTH domain|nr:helix-turn-helix domain-containing protein [Flavobacteriaceae bacterium]
MTNAIGENIRRFRELRGYSQEYMAHELDLTQSAYGKIEKETVKITVDRLQKIADILEVDLANLINSKNQNIFNQYNNQIANANGHVENQYLEKTEAYEKLIKSLEAQIALLQKLLEKSKL